MLFPTSFSLSSILISTALLQACSTLANPIDSSLTPRAPKQSCSGEYSGRDYGVLACVDVTFRDSNSITVDLTVRDTRGDSHDVYGWFVVYGSDDRAYTLPTNGKLRNSLGNGHTVSALGLRYDYPGGYRIVGVNARACVDDAGSDTCAPAGKTVTP